jgi:L-ribulose-5-phosphate 4-epimerase
MNDSLVKLRAEVCALAKKAAHDGMYAGTSGNISAYTYVDELMAITPTSMSYAEMEDFDIVVMKLDGTVISGGTPSSEWRLHARIYEALPDTAAVVHTHSPYATAFSVLRAEIPVFHIEMPIFLGGSIRTAPFAAQGSDEVGTGAVPLLKDRTSCLLANHGVVAIGADLQKAYTAAIYTEDAARIYHLALCAGKPFEIG